MSRYLASDWNILELKRQVTNKVVVDFFMAMKKSFEIMLLFDLSSGCTQKM
jgi:hypothetical protein